MKNLQNSINILKQTIESLSEQSKVLPRGEASRLIAIAKTDIEKSTWALEKAIKSLKQDTSNG